MTVWLLSTVPQMSLVREAMGSCHPASLPGEGDNFIPQIRFSEILLASHNCQHSFAPILSCTGEGKIFGFVFKARNNLFSALGQLSTVCARSSTASGLLLFKFTFLESRSKVLTNAVGRGACHLSTETLPAWIQTTCHSQALSCHLASKFLFKGSFSSCRIVHLQEILSSSLRNKMFLHLINEACLSINIYFNFQHLFIPSGTTSSSNQYDRAINHTYLVKMP